MVAAMQMADMKVRAQRSWRVWIRQVGKSITPAVYVPDAAIGIASYGMGMVPGETALKISYDGEQVSKWNNDVHEPQVCSRSPPIGWRIAAAV